MLTGAGGHFCAGADLGAIGDPGGVVMNWIRWAWAAVRWGPRLALSKPLIAAIEGYAVAGGLELALQADLRVVAEDSVLGVFAAAGLLIDGGIGACRIVGMGRALDLILTGREVAAAEALGHGLANRVVASGAEVAEGRRLPCFSLRRIGLHNGTCPRAAPEGVRGVPIVAGKAGGGCDLPSCAMGGGRGLTGVLRGSAPHGQIVNRFLILASFSVRWTRPPPPPAPPAFLQRGCPRYGAPLGLLACGDARRFPPPPDGPREPGRPCCSVPVRRWWRCAGTVSPGALRARALMAWPLMVTRPLADFFGCQAARLVEAGAHSHLSMRMESRVFMEALCRVAWQPARYHRCPCQTPPTPFPRCRWMPRAFWSWRRGRCFSFSTVSQGMFLVDLRGRIVWVNEGWPAFFPGPGHHFGGPVVGRTVEVIPNTGMRRVLETGRPCSSTC